MRLTYHLNFENLKGQTSHIKHQNISEMSDELLNIILAAKQICHLNAKVLIDIGVHILNVF